MNSPFLYLHKRKLTLPRDSTQYQELVSNTNKRVGWNFFTGMCLCKLYDLSSLPKFQQQIQMPLYITLVMTLCASKIFAQSMRQSNRLNELDKFYEQQFNQYIKNNGFQSIF